MTRDSFAGLTEILQLSFRVFVRLFVIYSRALPLNDMVDRHRRGVSAKDLAGIVLLHNADISLVGSGLLGGGFRPQSNELRLLIVNDGVEFHILGRAAVGHGPLNGVFLCQMLGARIDSWLKVSSFITSASSHYKHIWVFKMSRLGPLSDLALQIRLRRLHHVF